MSALWTGCVSAALMGLIAITAPSPAPADSCMSECHEAKSMAYERCRKIPPTDRQARLDCFKRADADLRRCLARCR